MSAKSPTPKAHRRSPARKAQSQRPKPNDAAAQREKLKARDQSQTSKQPSGKHSKPETKAQRHRNPARKAEKVRDQAWDIKDLNRDVNGN